MLLREAYKSYRSYFPLKSRVVRSLLWETKSLKMVMLLDIQTLKIPNYRREKSWMDALVLFIWNLKIPGRRKKKGLRVTLLIVRVRKTWSLKKEWISELK